MVKNLTVNSEDAGLIPGLGRFLEEEVSNTPVFLPRESHGQRSLAGPSPWGCKELDTTQHAHAYPLTRILLSKLKCNAFSWDYQRTKIAEHCYLRI